MSKIKNFFKKIGRWFVDHAPTKRKIIQVYAALLYNANLKGFISGRIYHGETKKVCVPGLNCYSCPGAVGSCPLGALQSALNDANKTAPYYMLGILALFGVIFGRTICGFLCPIGFFQELLFKIKTPKVKRNRITYIMSFFKYVLLLVTVIAIPIGFGFAGYANPAFCKYFCPAGTFGGGYFLLLNPNNSSMFDMLGVLFSWKTLLLILFILGSIFFYRFFCRFFCPLGLIYGFFNYFSVLGLTVNKSKCTDCGACVNVCRMDVRVVGDIECIQCGQCIKVCPEQAITWRGSKIFLHEDQLAPISNNIKIDLISNLPRIDNGVKEEKVTENVTETVTENVTTKEPVSAKIQNEKLRRKILTINAEILDITADLEYFTNVIKVLETEIALPTKAGLAFKNILNEELSSLNNLETTSISDSTIENKKREKLKVRLAKCTAKVSKLTSKKEQLLEKLSELYKELPDNVKERLIQTQTKPKIKRELYDKKKLKIYFISLFSVLTLLLGTALVYYNFIQTDDVASGEFNIGSIPENFSLELYNSDQTYTFDNQKFNDKLTVFNFWATWCGPCVAELPHFNEIQNEFIDDVDIIAIGDSNEETTAVETFINKQFVDYSITFAEDDEGNKIFRQFGGRDSLPYTVILNKLNKCVFMQEGKVSYEQLKAVIEENL